MRSARTAYLASLATFLGTQVLLWYVQPGGCTFTDMLNARPGCQATTILCILHAVVALLAAMLVIDAMAWWRKRKTRKQNRP